MKMMNGVYGVFYNEEDTPQLGNYISNKIHWRSIVAKFQTGSFELSPVICGLYVHDSTVLYGELGRQE